MSDLIFNLRIYQWHFQVTRSWVPKISRNNYHKSPWPDGRIKLYEPVR